MSLSPHPKQPIVIAGGGIAGLACALALARCGISCRIVEKRRQFVQEGAGIQIGPNGVRVLDALGLRDRLLPFSGAPAAIVVRDAESGAAIVEMPLPGHRRDDQESGLPPYLTLHRGDLHRGLLEAVHRTPRIVLEMASGITACEVRADGVRFELETGESGWTPLLIGADGAHSLLRQSHFGARPPLPAGFSAVRTVLPAETCPAEFTASVTGLWLGPHMHVVHYPIRNSADIAAVVVVRDDIVRQGWSSEVSRDWLLAKCRDIAPPLRGLIGEGDDWRAWSLFKADKLSGYTSGRLVLIGDAAHPVLPFLAQGGVMALEDALVLADALGTFEGAFDEALSAFNHRRFKRTQRVARISERNGRIYHLSGAQARLRNFVMRQLGGSFLMRSYDWLYDWTPDASA